MNGESLPLEEYFDSCPDFMFMINGKTRTITNFNGSVKRNVGEEILGRNVWEIISLVDDKVSLPRTHGEHARFLANVVLKTGDTILLDFNSTYLLGANCIMLTGRIPLAQ